MCVSLSTGNQKDSKISKHIHNQEFQNFIFNSNKNLPFYKILYYIAMKEKHF